MNRIGDVLKEIEFKHHVKILYACEAGSRSYGFASENSDFDVRFIYIAPLREYLTLLGNGDTITLQDANFDIQGWDLKKTLLLARKSNPSLYEWMLSPIVYREMDPVILQLQAMVLKGYSQKVLGYHYVKMAKKNLLAWCDKRNVAYLVHAVRASLMLEQVLSDRSSTIQLKELEKTSRFFHNEELSLLYRLKMGECLNEHPKIVQLPSKISDFLNEPEVSLIQLDNGSMDIKVLEKLFFQQLGIEGENHH